MCVFGKNVLQVSVRSIWFITSASSSVSRFNFCLNDLSIGETGVLKFPTISVQRSICDLSYSSISSCVWGIDAKK